MASEFEELRLTVNLVDNATAGLTKIRGEIGQLTGSASALTQAVNRASSGVTNLGTVATKTAPGVRQLNTVMREASRSAAELKDGFQRLGASTQGLRGLPAIASSVRDMGLAMHGLGGAFASAGSSARLAVVGIGSVAIAVAALGASVVAYGVSVFKFAREMDMLGKTAKQMGMTFAELKYAQDEAKRFGMSSESIIRSFQGVQAAQFDLWKNNSQLRQKLIGMGVDANWVNQLAAMEPNKARNAIVGYGKALERQLLDAGVAKNVARALRNQFGSEFGFSAEDMDIELPNPSPQTKKELERIGEQSKEIGKLWGEIGHQWNLFSTEMLAMGLPIVLEGLKGLQDQLPALLADLKVGLKGIIDSLPGLVDSIPGIITGIAKELRDVAAIFGGIANLYGDITRETAELNDGATSGDQDKDRPSPPISALRPQTASPRATGPGNVPGVHLQSFQGGANDNNPLLIRAAFSTEELTDETGKNTSQVEKLTSQLEKLNAYFDRATGGAGGGGGGGFQNAAYHPDGGGGGGGGDGGGGGAASFGNSTYRNLGDGSGSGGGSGSGSGTTSAPSSPGDAPASGPMGALPGLDPTKIPYHTGGALTMEGKTYHYGSGGAGRGSTPPGSYPVNVATPYGGKGQLGDIGRRIGSIATVGGLGGTYKDPRYSTERSGVQIHPASSDRLDQLYSQGCFAVARSEWPAFKAHLIDLNKRTPGGLQINVGKDGNAQIIARGAKIPMPDQNSVPAVAQGPANDNASKGDYPASMLTARTVRKTERDLLNADAPDRGALLDSTKVRADGSVKVQVGGGSTKTAAAKGDGLFTNTPLQRSTAGQLTEHGANAYETANQYMASR